MRLRMAKIISTFSHPVVVFPASVPFFAVQSNLTIEKFLLYLPILLILAVPIIYYLYALKTKKISDWEVTKRQERYPIYILSLICGGIALVSLKIFSDQGLFTLAVIFYLVAIVLTVINFFWKISVHTAGVTSGILGFNFLFNEPAWLYFLIPLVAWSRLEEKKHTLTQSLGGIVLGTIVVAVVLGVRQAGVL